MWLRKKEEVIDPKLAEVESRFPSGTVCTYLGNEVTVINHHCKSCYYFGRNIWIINAGVNVEWWTTTKEIRRAFINYNDLKFLIVK